MRNERRPSGSGMGAAETGAGNRVSAPRPHFHLFETLTRHFQRWRRWKGFWEGQFAEGHDPGLTYDRDGIEAAARVTPATSALDEEARLIRRLKPRDNLLGQPELAEVPF